MSKITKLFKSPRLFFSDSIWFDYETPTNPIRSRNLFVISNLGQLTKIEALIDHKKIEDNYLVILYTDANKNMPLIILQQHRKSFFNGSTLLRLPRSPNRIVIKNLFYIKRSYTALLHKIKPNSLFILSFESHYSVLASIARKENISLSLIEEGTGTYKSKTSIRDNNRFNNEYIKRYIINGIPIFRGLRPALNWHTDFDHIYATFPKLLKGTFTYKEIHKIFLHPESLIENRKSDILANKYGMTNKDIIYVNQKYPLENKLFTEVIIYILENIIKTHKCKVFIKMHPKDVTSLKNEFKRQIFLSQFNENIIYIEESDFLIEPIISLVHPRLVVGLTSTSLIYTPIISPDTTTYSIAPLFIKLSQRLKDNNRNGCNIISSHLEILKKFDHIVFIDSVDKLPQFNNHQLRE